MNKPEPNKPEPFKPHVTPPTPAPKSTPKSEAPVTDIGKVEKELDTIESQSLTSDQHAAVTNIRDILKIPDDTTPIEPAPETKAAQAPKQEHDRGRGH